MPQSKFGRWAFYGMPMLFCLAVHWVGLKTWFRTDDFAWLGLHLDVTGWRDWLDVFFGPRAQGTIRTVSERLYFVVFTSIFGLNALPFRIWEFLTAFADIALIGWITRRVTGSALAGFVAAMLWPANAGLALPLDWSSAYNELCCTFFMLLAFAMLLRYLDTCQERFWIWQWAAFLAGFGALELIVTYPAMASLYTWLFDRKRWARTLWLFIPSVLFTVFHFVYIPASTDPSYKMHFDAGMVTTLARYWAFTVAAARPEVVDWRPVWLGVSLALVMALGAMAILVRRTRLTLFFLAWFLISLLPLLPLSSHFSDYYVTIPAVGFAMLGGLAIAEFPKVAGPLVLIAMIVGVSDIRVADDFFYPRTRSMRRLITGLIVQRPAYEGKTVLLTGVDDDLFWTGFLDDPFRLIGIQHIYLAPGSGNGIAAHPEWGDLAKFQMPLDTAFEDVRKGKAVVFAMGRDGQVRESTKLYTAIAGIEYLEHHRDIVDVGDPLYASRLGPGWYEPEKGFRWMAGRASIQISGPMAEHQKLHLTGYSPESVLQKGPLRLKVSADGISLGVVELRKGDARFAADLILPASLVGKNQMEVKLELSRTTRIGTDARPLGIIFGTFRVR